MISKKMIDSIAVFVYIVCSAGRIRTCEYMLQRHMSYHLTTAELKSHTLKKIVNNFSFELGSVRKVISEKRS